MADAEVRIGLVGYGFGGRYFHAPLIASTPGVTFAGVVTRSPDRRAEVAHDHPSVGTFGSIADLLAAGVDAVTVCTPAATHTELTEELLRRGVHQREQEPAHPAMWAWMSGLPGGARSGGQSV